MTPDPQHFLSGCSEIDIEDPNIVRLARQLSAHDDFSTAKRCFEFVRDEIQHSSDFKQNPVTCSASSVLKHRTGFCYAKSHLLCALLRVNVIPAGLCYQRLSLNGIGAPYCLHGLAIIFLPDTGWYRVDPRGNRDDIHAEFSPPIEQLAFSTGLPGERDLPEIHVSPKSVVLTALQQNATWEELSRNLPDEPREQTT